MSLSAASSLSFFFLSSSDGTVAAVNTAVIKTLNPPSRAMEIWARRRTTVPQKNKRNDIFVLPLLPSVYPKHQLQPPAHMYGFFHEALVAYVLQQPDGEGLVAQLAELVDVNPTYCKSRRMEHDLTKGRRKGRESWNREKSTWSACSNGSVDVADVEIV